MTTNNRRRRIKVAAVGAFLSFDVRISVYLEALKQSLADRVAFIILNTAAPRHILPDLRLTTLVIQAPPDCQDIFPTNCEPGTAAASGLPDPNLDCLAWARDSLQLVYPRLTRSSATNYAAAFYRYAMEFLEDWRPALLLIWNQFVPFHYVLGELAKARGLRVIYMEYGVLPGSFSFDRAGQVGESFPAARPDEFNRLEILPADEQRMARHLEALRLSGRSHRPQPTVPGPGSLLAALNPGRPTIFYAGQSDGDAGLAPYTVRARHSHSPLFADSLEALYALDQLAYRNKWNLIFKPHPIVWRKGSQPLKRDLKATLVLPEADINVLIDRADLITTIVSQCSYLALIRQKPVLMMGYNALKCSGAVYRGWSLETLEQEFQRALAGGYRQEMKSAFLRHAARLARHYLYADHPEGREPYAGTVEDCAAHLLDWAD